MHQLVRRGPVLGLLGEAGADERREVVGYAGEVWLVVDDLVGDDVGTVGVERPAPGGRVHGHRAQGEDVGGGPDLPGPPELLGGHERRGADQLPGLGAQFTVLRPGDTEVDDLGSVLGEQDVAGLEIPVHHTGTVDVAQGLREPGHEPPQLPGRHGAVPLDVLREGRAGDEEGGHPGPGAVGVGIDDGRGEGTADLPGGGDLLPETPPELGVLGELGVHHLHREPQAGGRGGQMDDAHATRTQTRLQTVLTGVLRKFRFRSRPGAPLRCHGSTPVLFRPLSRRTEPSR